MKNTAKKILSVTLCLLMLTGTFAFGGDAIVDRLFKADATAITSYSTGDIIEFGWYPQSKITDSTIISELNGLAGNHKEWTSYNYYSGSGYYDDGTMKPSDFMRYTDIVYSGNRYRGVRFDSCRPYSTGNTSETSWQEDNGYYPGVTYWFRYDPIKWRVLDAEEGLVLTENILDAQAFCNYIYYDYDVADPYHDFSIWGNAEKTFYSNNYKESSIRQWLNYDFYNTAFSSEQQELIQLTKLENNSYTDAFSAYGSASTTDKIYLLSYDDAINPEYGFGTDPDAEDDSKETVGTDYAMCQGLYEYSAWYLRSAGEYGYDICSSIYGGYINIMEGTYNSSTGIRAALNINTSSDIIQCDVSDTERKLPSVISSSLSDNSVEKGDKLKWIIKTSTDVEYIKLTDKYTGRQSGDTKTVSAIYKYTSKNSALTVKDNGNERIWTIEPKFSFSTDDYAVDMDWTVYYKVKGSKSYEKYNETPYEVVCGYTAPAPYSLISVTGPETVEKTGTRSAVVIKTTTDCTKVRIGTGGKYTTFQTTSNNVTYVDDEFGIRTWTVNYKFAATGETEYSVSTRGTSWCEAQTFKTTIG